MSKKKTIGQIRTSKSYESGSRKCQSMSSNKIVHGSAENSIPSLANGTVNLVITSPPYAEQRKQQYGGVPEKDYPEWMVSVMETLKPKLADGASVLLNISPHVRDNQLADYTLKTRLALREAGWREHDEIIWHKPDAFPLGHPRGRLRRSWESIHWFSLSKKPYCDPTAAQTKESWTCGGPRAKKSIMHGLQVEHAIVAKKPRCPNVLRVPVGSVDKGVNHTAMFPRGVPKFLIETFSKPSDLIADIFAGSGTTLLAAQSLGRRYWGCDQSVEYTCMARKRLATEREAWVAD